jgi:hypothetical protein
MVQSKTSNDEIHVFHRISHRSNFTYKGIVEIDDYVLYKNKKKSSKFDFIIINEVQK